MPRKEETLRFSSFQLGTEYTRNEIAAIGEVEPLVSTREWTGIVQFENCVVLFSTLDKEPFAEEYSYADYFSGDKFYWESQNRNTQNTGFIQRIIGLEAPVLLFCRESAKVNNQTCPFIYVGSLTAEDYESNHPVQMRFHIDNYEENSPDTLKALSTWRKGIERTLRPLELPDRKPKKATGQGFQADPDKKDAVELRAMNVAKTHYESLGFHIEDTSANKPYDLLCRQGAQLIRVEVKGLSGALGAVSVTYNEVESAIDQNYRTDLFIVHSIEVKEIGLKEYRGDDGIVVTEEEWRPLEERLKPISYRYSPIEAEDS